MVIVQGLVRMAPAEIARLQPAAVEMMRATKAAEPGCLDYAYAIDVAEPDLLHVIERWRDDAALQAHFATPHMAAFGTAMADARMTGMSVKAYAGEEVRTLMER